MGSWYYLKSFGHVIDMDRSHYNVEAHFNLCCASDREIWKLDDKNVWTCIRRMRNGKEAQQHVDLPTA